GSLGFLKLMMPESQITLTLPGIAGIILTLGMAVDANVLINERIREELANRRPFAASIRAGLNRAFNALIHCRVPTPLSSFILFQFGSGPIKGFAVTLSIGLIASLFTSLYVSRTLFMFLLEYRMIKGLHMVQLFRHTNFNFINKRYFAYVFSLLIVGLG